jgi:hypothetical protein
MDGEKNRGHMLAGRRQSQRPERESYGRRTAPGFAMGIKVRPTKGTPFATFRTGSDCPSIGGQNFNIESSALGVPHGATLEFTEASTKPTPTLGGNAASFENTETLGILNEESGK